MLFIRSNCNSLQVIKKSWTYVFSLMFIVCYLAPERPSFAQGKLHSIQGKVKDQFQGVVVGAQVMLQVSDAEQTSTVTNEQGSFRFDRLKPGPYRLAVMFKGFAKYETDLELNESTPSHNIEVILNPTVEASVLITGEDKVTTLDPKGAVGSQVLNQKDLQALSDDPDQLREQLEVLATSSGSAPGQATVTVDGFKSMRLPPKSAIKAVRVNPDLYSAEYDKVPYRGGRIEVDTQPGATSFHGSVFFNYNNSILNARDAFAPSRPSTDTRWYGFDLGGPIKKKKMGFLLNFEARDINESSAVNAIILDKAFNPVPFTANVATPLRLLTGSGRVDWQANPKNSLIFRYELNRSKLENQGVGGFNLTDTAFNSSVSEQNFRISANSVISATAYNEARLGITSTSLKSNAASNSPLIVVPGFFTSGGANLQLLSQDAFRVELADNLFYVAKKHRLKFGLQLYGDYIDQVDASNFNGLFTFGGAVAPELDSTGQIVTGRDGPVLINISGLEQYRRALLGLPGGVASQFAISSGDPGENISQWNLGLFVQDEWSVRKNVLVSLGLRSESQTNPSDKLSLAPRVGIAYSPDSKQAWVLRARAGIFYDRIPETLPVEAIRFDGAHIKQVLLNSPSFPNPSLTGISSSLIPTIRRIDDDINPPRSLQVQLGFEHQLPRGWKLDFSHSFARTLHSLRSRNINAPIIAAGTDPGSALRPNGIDENIFLFESSGKVRGQVAVVGIRGTIKFITLNARYLHFNYHNDTDNLFTLPQFSHDLTGEWSRPSWQSSNRMFMTIDANLPWKITSSLFFSAAQGTPFNITTGQDNNGDGSFTDRPNLVNPGSPGAVDTRFGVFDPAAINGNLSRNFGTNPAKVNLDLNFSRTFLLSKGKDSGGRKERYKAAVGVRISNLLNYTNVTGLNGVLNSPFFGLANTALPSRHVEIGLRFTF